MNLITLFVGVLLLLHTQVSFPIPSSMLFRDPGIPKLLTTYHVSNDFFFSGHTAFTAMGAFELIRWLAERRQKAQLSQASRSSGCTTATVVWLCGTIMSLLLLCLQMFFVIVFHTHYVQDVVAGMRFHLQCAA